MERAALVRYLIAHGANLRERGKRTEVYGTAAGEAAVPLRVDIEPMLVESICRALAIEPPRDATGRKARRTLGREKVVIRVTESVIVIDRGGGRSGTPRGGGRGRKRNSRG